MTDKFKGNPKTARHGYEILPLEMGYLPEFYRRKAEEELHDTPENRLKGLKALKAMIENDKHMNGWNFDEDFLLSYLKNRKFDASRAFSKLKAFVSIRKKHKSMFTDYNFEDVAIGVKQKFFTYLPYRCQDGCVIVLIKLDNWIPEQFPVESIRKLVVIGLFQALRDPMTQVNGFKVIVDVESNLLQHIRYITPSNVGLLCYGPLECTAGRFKEIHFINKSICLKIALLIVNRVMSPKLRNRIIIHEDASSLLDYFPAACIPVEYGGDLKDYDITDWLKSVMTPEKLETMCGGKSPPEWQ